MAVAAKAKRKRPAVVAPRAPGDLSGCPRWQALRVRVVFFEDLASAEVEEESLGHRAL